MCISYISETQALKKYQVFPFMQKYLQSVCLDKGKPSMLSDLSLLWSVFGYKYVVHINPSGKYSTVSKRGSEL